MTGEASNHNRHADTDVARPLEDAVAALRAELKTGAGAVPVLEVLAGLHEVLDRVDPAQVAPRQGADLVVVCDRIERVAAAAKGMAATRVAESSLWRRGGHRSPAHWMAATTGVTVAEATRLMQTAQLAETAPAEISDAISSGRVSNRKGAAIGRAATADPERGRGLLEQADTMSLTEIETEAARITAAASTETDEQRVARHHKARRLRTGVNADGMGWGSWLMPLAEHTRFMNRIGDASHTAFHTARQSGVHEPSEAYALDGLLALIDNADNAATTDSSDSADSDRGDSTASLGNGTQTNGTSTRRAKPGRTGRWGDAKIIIRVDLPVLARGRALPGELCEIAGHGPTPASTVWDMIDGGAFIAGILTNGTHITHIHHLGRHPTALQRTALQWATAGTCAIQGCDSVARLEIDHVADWAHTHRTELPHLAAVCGHHHDLKTHHGYTYGPTQPNGKRPLIPPDTRPPHTSDQPELFDTS
jgi:hypothetical protein